MGLSSTVHKKDLKICMHEDFFYLFIFIFSVTDRNGSWLNKYSLFFHHNLLTLSAKYIAFTFNKMASACLLAKSKFFNEAPMFLRG